MFATLRLLCTNNSPCFADFLNHPFVTCQSSNLWSYVSDISHSNYLMYVLCIFALKKSTVRGVVFSWGGFWLDLWPVCSEGLRGVFIWSIKSFVIFHCWQKMKHLVFFFVYLLSKISIGKQNAHKLDAQLPQINPVDLSLPHLYNWGLWERPHLQPCREELWKLVETALGSGPLWVCHTSGQRGSGSTSCYHFLSLDFISWK